VIVTSSAFAASRRRLTGVARGGAFRHRQTFAPRRLLGGAEAISEPSMAKTTAMIATWQRPVSVDPGHCIAEFASVMTPTMLFRREVPRGRNSVVSILNCVLRKWNSFSHPPRSSLCMEFTLTRASSSQRLEPLRHVDAGVLNIAYYEAGPADGPAVMLLHGFPYDIHAYVDVAPLLAANGCRTIVPYCAATAHAFPRPGDAALGRAGRDRGRPDRADGRAWREARRFRRLRLGRTSRLRGRGAVAGPVHRLVSVNGYLIQDIAKAMVPAKPEREVRLWYQYYFQLERGRAGLAADRRGIARILWLQWSPNWQFDDATFERTAEAHDNPGYVDIVIHSYRHRYGQADGDPQYADLQRRLAALPVIAVPTITLDGEGDGVAPATDGTRSASKFTGRRSHRVIPRAGHNLPQKNLKRSRAR